MTPTPIDFELRAIARAAEEGAKLERIVLVCGSTLYLGTPVSSTKFSEATTQSYASDIARSVGNWRTSQAEKESIAQKQSQIALEPFLAAVRNSRDLDTISLCPAQVHPPGMSHYEVHAIRVRIDRIDAWWAGWFTENPAKVRGGGGGVGVGVGVSF
ncbi:hypothetical protein [Arthrobacter sp. zg-Y179]|uniref:hypothetical protein n=1 Tax=Arthrobacter sp. zg-Y179 TaxID=2894188 RepID=UPI001E5C3349|nr:hypothetical protein [Arthrobacter sp. zg-Y179]MCC9173873.1 hypothetical protein [Arthrobacter sp. zg-Y179]